MREPLFVPAPFFLVRTPLAPIEEYERILAEANWVEELFRFYRGNELLREAISIASPSLYQALQKKPLQETAVSLLNYALRRSTRATPFGLFSFVSRGSWAPTPSLSIDLETVYKRARPDMAWIYAVVQKLYEDESLFPSLSVRLNPLTSFRAGRAFLTYGRQAEKSEETRPKDFSIHVSPWIGRLFALAQEPRSIDALFEQLRQTFPQLDREKVDGVIRQLLTNQFLLPGILPSLLSDSPFTDLLPHLPPSMGIELIGEKITAYNQQKPGTGEPLLTQIQKEMEAIAKTKTYLQVDAASEASVEIPKFVGEEFEKAVAFLWKLSASLAAPYRLKNYHEKFLEKYGTHRTVPLLELLDEEKGLGSYLAGNSAPSPKPQTPFSQEWEAWLANRWQDCLVQKKEEIVLHEKELEPLFALLGDSLPNPQKAPLSIDVFCKILTQSPEELEKGLFSILFCQSNWQGGSTTGRFSDFLSEERKQELSKFYRQEESLEKNTLFVELSYWPSSVRTANVAIHPCFRRYHLDVEEKTKKEGSLTLNDIYVGASLDRLYLTLESGEAEIDACFGDLLNLTYAPLPLRFLREVTIAKRAFVYPFSWGKVEEIAVFLPRVRFGKTILLPAQWTLRGAPFAKEPLKNISSQFTAWADQWRLPRRFLLTRDDQHLLLDRAHPAHLHEIATKLKKGESLKFMEHLENGLIQTQAGHHSSEIVLSFSKNPLYAQKQSISIPQHVPVPFENRWKLPGSEWLFAQFYLGEEGQDRFLLQHLCPFIEQLKQTSEPISWFFVRYRNPEPHLRFRIKLPSRQAYSFASSLLERFSMDWIKKGLTKEMVLASYQREVERYGGLELSETAETLFCADTLASLHLLHMIASKKLVCHEAVFQTLSALSFLKSFGFDEEMLVSLLQTDPKDQAALEGFREHKRDLLALAKSLDEHPIFSAASNLRKEAAMHLRARAETLSFHAQLSLYGSLLHMHCNRIGCNGVSERRALLYARHTMLQLQHVLKKPELSCP